MPLWFPETAGPGNRNKMGTWGTAHRPAVPPCPIGEHLPKPYAFPVALASPRRIWLDVVVRAIWRRQCAGDKMPETIWWKSLDRACLAARRRCFLRALDKSPDKSPGITRQHRPGIHSSCQCPRGCLAPGRKPGDLCRVCRSFGAKPCCQLMYQGRRHPSRYPPKPCAP